MQLAGLLELYFFKFSLSEKFTWLSYPFNPLYCTYFPLISPVVYVHAAMLKYAHLSTIGRLRTFTISVLI